MATNIASTASGDVPPTFEPGAHAHDFDFLPGSWRVHHRRLRHRLAGSDEWEEFEGSSEVRPILGGAGFVDDNVIELPAGTYRSISLRTYDPATDSWSIWWLDGRTPSRLDPPMIGRFDGGVGTFMGEDTFDGRPILVRFLWSNVTEHAADWEQAFSPDGGRTWEVNWRMALTRAE